MRSAIQLKACLYLCAATLNKNELKMIKNLTWASQCIIIHVHTLIIKINYMNRIISLDIMNIYNRFSSHYKIIHTGNLLIIAELHIPV